MFAEKTREGQSDPAVRLREFCRCYILVVTTKGYEFSREIIKISLDQQPDPNVVESNQHWQTIHDLIAQGQDAGGMYDNSYPDLEGLTMSFAMNTGRIAGEKAAAEVKEGK